MATTPPLETAVTSEIEPPPSSIDVSMPAVPKADSLASRMVDSSNKKALKTILRTVSGTPKAASVTPKKEKTPSKR